MSSKTDTTRRWTAIVALTVIVGAVLRFIGLGFGLWYDEIMTLVLSARHPIGQILTEFPGVNAHPLYSVLAHASLRLFGESAWALRLPAAVFGVASIAIVYVIGLRLMTRLEAWAAAAVLATSYHHIWFSQNARGFTLIGFLTLVSTLYLLRARESGRWQDLAVYAVAAAAGIYTHLTMAFVVAGHVVVILAALAMGWRPAAGYRLRPLLAAWIFVGVLTGLAYAPFVPGLITLMNLPVTRAAASVATAGWALGDAIRSVLSGAGVSAALAGGCFAAVGAVSLWRRQPLAWALLMAPTVVTALAITALRQPLRPRFFFFLSAAAALFVARGIGATVEWLRRRDAIARRLGPATGLVLCTAGLIALSAAALPRNYQVPKQDFDGAMTVLNAAEAQGARIAAGFPICLPMELYYEKSWPCLRTMADLTSHAAGDGRLVVAYSLAEYIEDPALRDALKNRCDVIARFPGTLGGGEITVCEAR